MVFIKPMHYYYFFNFFFRFVKAVLPLPMTSMYAMRFYTQAAATFRELAALRPEMVLPVVIER